MQQNYCTVVDEVSEVTCVGFDELGEAVESHYAGVADSALYEVEQPISVTL